MNLSETAFLVRRGSGGYDLRGFTPAVEIVVAYIGRKLGI